MQIKDGNGGNWDFQIGPSHFLLLKTMLEEHDYLKEDIYK